MIKRPLYRAVALLGVWLSSSTSQAMTIANTYGTNYSYNQNNLFLISTQSSFLGYARSHEERFHVTYSSTVRQIDVALAHVLGSSSARISLWTDVAGNDGSLIGSWDVSGYPQADGQHHSPTSIMNISGITLIHDESYLLRITGLNDTYSGWHSVDASVGPLYSAAAYDIMGDSAVPEPSSWALMTLGAFCVGALVRRRSSRLGITTG